MHLRTYPASSKLCSLFILLIACLLLIASKLSFIISDQDKGLTHCSGLLHGGKYNLTQWTSDGCVMRSYSSSEAEICMSRIRKTTEGKSPGFITFIGDSRVRQLRDELYGQLTGTYIDWLANHTIPHDESTYRKHSDKAFYMRFLRIEYYWADDIPHAYKKLREIGTQYRNNDSYPYLLIFGRGLWTTSGCLRSYGIRRDCTLYSILTYRRLMTRVISLLGQYPTSTRILVVPQTPTTRALLNTAGDSGELIPSYVVNRELTSIFTENNGIYPHVALWRSFATTFSLNDSLDGIHMGPITKHANIQIILNFVCNSLSGDGGRQVNYCCSRPDSGDESLMRRNKFSVLL